MHMTKPRLVQPMGAWPEIGSHPQHAAGTRERVSDREIELLIVEMIDAGIRLYTPQLHHLRRSGIAVEQSRLRRLFDGIRARTCPEERKRQ